MCWHTQARFRRHKDGAQGAVCCSSMFDDRYQMIGSHIGRQVMMRSWHSAAMRVCGEVAPHVHTSRGLVLVILCTVYSPGRRPQTSTRSHIRSKQGSRLSATMFCVRTVGQTGHELACSEHRIPPHCAHSPTASLRCATNAWSQYCKQDMNCCAALHSRMCGLQASH